MHAPCPHDWCPIKAHPVGSLHTPGKHRAPGPALTEPYPYFPLHRADGAAR